MPQPRCSMRLWRGWVGGIDLQTRGFQISRAWCLPTMISAVKGKAVCRPKNVLECIWGLLHKDISRILSLIPQNNCRHLSKATIISFRYKHQHSGKQLTRCLSKPMPRTQNTSPYCLPVPDPAHHHSAKAALTAIKFSFLCSSPMPCPNHAHSKSTITTSLVPSGSTSIFPFDQSPSHTPALCISATISAPFAQKRVQMLYFAWDADLGRNGTNSKIR